MANSDNQSVQQQPPVEGEILSEEEKKKLPPEIQKVVTMMQSYEGPLPPASEFAKYEKVQKGSANRIIKMAETALDAEIKDRSWHNVTVFSSMIASRGLLYLLVVVSVILILNGKEAAGFLTAIVPAIQVLSNIDFSRKKPNETQKGEAKTQPAKTNEKPKKKVVKKKSKKSSKKK